MPDRKPRRPSMRKTGKRSPHFPLPTKGPAKSSYFTLRRRSAGSRRGLNAKGRAEDAVGATVVGWEGGGDDAGSCESLEDVMVITEQSFLEGTGGCRDGWMTEVESKHNKEARRERKRRKERVGKKRKKLDEGLREIRTGVESSVVTVPDGSGVQRLGREDKGCVQNPFSELGNSKLAVFIECRKSSQNTSEIRAKKTGIKKNINGRRKRKREERRNVESEKLSMPVEQSTGPLEQPPRHSKKRKRSATLEIHINPLSKPSPDASLKISDRQPGKGHRKIGGNGLASAKIENECPPAEEDTLEARISRYWSKKYLSKIDACGDMEISADKSPPKTMISRSQVIQQGKGNKLQTLDVNTWSRACVSNGDAPSRKPPNTVTPILAPRATLQNNIGDQFSSMKVKPVLPSNIPRSILPPPSPIIEPYRNQTTEGLGTVPDSTPKKSAATPRKCTRRKTKKTEIVSKYFASSATEPPPPEKKPRKNRTPAGTSVIPWPPLTAKDFGLIQEELRDNAFHLIIAAMFLNKIRGSTAIPLLRQFLVDYPTPQALSQGDYDTIKDFLWPLGLQRIRAKRLIEMAKVWIANPPTPGKGVRKYNYPPRDTKPFNFPVPPDAPDGDPEVCQRPKLGAEQGCEWEIAHLPGVGAYALDSWRIFCLDGFRKGMINGGGSEGQVEEEWRRVVPKDKELRACLRWRWAKEGLRWREIGDMEVEVEGGVNCEVPIQEQNMEPFARRPVRNSR